MESMELMQKMVQLVQELGQVKQVHLYEGGVITVEGEGFALHYVKKEDSHGGAADVCQVHR